MRMVDASRGNGVKGAEIGAGTTEVGVGVGRADMVCARTRKEYVEDEDGRGDDTYG